MTLIYREKKFRENVTMQANICYGYVEATMNQGGAESRMIKDYLLVLRCGIQSKIEVNMKCDDPSENVNTTLQRTYFHFRTRVETVCIKTL